MRRSYPRAHTAAAYAGAALAAAAATLAIAACGGGSPIPAASVTTEVTSTTVTTTPVGTPTIAAGPEDVAPETGAPLASAATTEPGSVVDDIQCESLQQLAYRDYAHLLVYVHGHPESLPGAIGLLQPRTVQGTAGISYSSGQCTYWLFTSAADGVIHVESPIPNRFTLGDFFDVWNQRLGTGRVAGARGRVTAFVDGHRWRRNPRLIPLEEHSSIQLDVGKPIKRFRPFNWTGTNL